MHRLFDLILVAGGQDEGNASNNDEDEAEDGGGDESERNERRNDVDDAAGLEKILKHTEKGMGIKEKLLNGRFQNFQIDALRCIAAENTQQRAQGFDGLSALADQFTHVSVTDAHGQKNSELIDAGLDRQLIAVFHQRFQDVAKEFQAGHFCFGRHRHVGA